MHVEALQQSLAKDERYAHEQRPVGDLIALEIDAAEWTFAETVEATLLAALKAYSTLKNESNHVPTRLHLHETVTLIDVQIGFANMKTRGTSGEQQTEIYKVIFSRLKFAPEVVHQAQHILDKMQEMEGNTLTFNGVHLRIERDILTPDQQSEILQDVLNGMARDGFNTSTLLYIASGIFEDNDRLVQTKVLNKVKPFCTQAVYHNKWKSTNKVLQDFNPEQAALVDFLVLAKSERFLGTSSSMSMFLMNYRQLHYSDQIQTFVKPPSRLDFYTHLFFENAFGELPET